MRMENRDGTFFFESSRRATPASFSVNYRPASEIHYAAPGTLEHWLTERYCLYVATERQVWRAEIQHAPWLLQAVEAEILRNTVAEAAGGPVQGNPVLLGFALRQEVLVWPLKRA